VNSEGNCDGFPLALHEIKNTDETSVEKLSTPPAAALPRAIWFAEVNVRDPKN
jgi:hypothetical protein